MIQGDSYVLINDLTVPLRSVVVAKDFHGSYNFNSRRIGGHDNNALLIISLSIGGITFTKYKVKFGPGITRPTNPPDKTVNEKTLRCTLNADHLCPLMTISLPSLRIDVLMFVASEE